MFFVYQMFCSYEAWHFVWVVVVYKHLVPLGPKTTATNNTDWFVTRTLESTHQEPWKTELRFTKPHKTAPGKILFPMISWIALSLFASRSNRAQLPGNLCRDARVVFQERNVGTQRVAFAQLCHARK